MSAVPVRPLLRTTMNWINLSTVCGLVIAWLGCAHIRRISDGIWIAADSRLMLPRAGAFTVGSVIVTARPAHWLTGQPRLMAHEIRHAGQYAWCMGLPMVLLYLVASGWSWMVVGDPASRNVFEVRAGARRRRISQKLR